MNCKGSLGPAGDNANLNAPGGTNVLFVFGTDGTIHCLDGRIVNIMRSTDLAKGIVGEGFAQRSVAEILADPSAPTQQYCGL